MPTDLIENKSPEVKAPFGGRNVKPSDIPNLQVEFLEIMAERWPLTMEFYLAVKDGKSQSHIELIEAEDAKILKRAEEVLHAILWLRVGIRKKVEASQALQIETNDRMKEDFRFMINYWMYIHEPRMPRPLRPKLPFVLYPAQERVLMDMERAYKTNQNLIVFKSRGAGISWGFCALEVHHWKYLPEYRCIMGSEKEEKVDIKGSSNPLFGKLRYLIYTMPKWWLPKTFETPDGPNDNERRLINPDNGSELIGEIGRNIGRSGRASRVIIDESQELQDPKAVDFALEDVTNCRIDVGTAAGMNHFGQKVTDGKLKVSVIGWEEDPRKTPTWRENKFNTECPWRKYIESTRDPVVIAQEYDRDLNASVEDAFIPPQYVKAAIDFDIPMTGERAAGFDVAGSGENSSVYVSRVGPVLLMPRHIPFKTSTEAAWEAVDLAVEDKVRVFNYDQDGIGEGVYGQFKTADRPIPFILNGIHGNSAASERVLEGEGMTAREKFRNKRAENWWNLYIRFKKTYEVRNNIRIHPADELISIPNHPTLISQLSQPKRVRRGSKIGVEAKAEMKSRGVKSPDFADATANAFSDYDQDDLVIGNFDYTKDAGHFRAFEVNHERAGGDQYGVVLLTPDMITHALCCLWWPNPARPLLQIYDEYVYTNASVNEIVRELNEAMCSNKKRVKEWIANDAIFKGMDDGRAAPWFLYKKAGVKLHRNYTDEYSGSILLVNQMFAANMIQVHKNCENLMMQLTMWKRTGGKPGSGLGLAMALCQLVTRLKRKREIPEARLRAPSYGGADRFAGAPAQDFEAQMNLKRMVG